MNYGDRGSRREIALFYHREIARPILEKIMNPDYLKYDGRKEEPPYQTDDVDPVTESERLLSEFKTLIPEEDQTKWEKSFAWCIEELLEIMELNGIT
jgi:hypothetical protein